MSPAGFSYTEDLSVFVEKTLGLLDIWCFLHTGTKRAFGKWQREPEHLVSDRARGCSRSRCESMLLAEENCLHASHLRVEERLQPAHRADRHQEAVQRRFCPAYETPEVRSRQSSWQAISIRAVERSKRISERYAKAYGVYSLAPSTTPIAREAGNQVVTYFQPAFSRRAAYSSCVRSRPVPQHIM